MNPMKVLCKLYLMSVLAIAASVKFSRLEVGLLKRWCFDPMDLRDMR